jgi:hypothetical protein
MRPSLRTPKARFLVENNAEQFIAFVIWGLRQALRLWAVQKDLHIDAQERLGMLSIFAALKGAGWLKREDVTTLVNVCF